MAAWCLVLLAATHQGRAAAANLEVFARSFDTRGPQVVCNDFFCNSVTVIPPANVVDSRSAAGFGHTTDRQSLSASSQIGDAAASAQLAHQTNSQGTTLNGVGAEATMSSVFHSEARARLRVEYIVDVQLNPGSPIGLALFASTCPNGCTLAVDFLHQTSGTFLHSAVVPGASARFTETVQVQQMQVTGEAFIGADPQNAGQLLHGAGGSWSSNDFLSSQTVPRPGGHGPGDTLTRTGFNHFEPILGATGTFTAAGAIIFGEFNLVIEQSVEAGFGNAGAYTVGPTTIGADFSHTSTFSVQRAYDPTGQLDLSGLDLSVQFIDVTPVPEHGTAGLLLAGLGLVALRRRLRRAPALAALAMAAAVLPARADLKLESQHLRAWVQLAEPGTALSGPSVAAWGLGEPPGPVTVVKAARGDSLAAAARQTPDGFFQSTVTLDQQWEDPTGAHTVVAGTSYESLITTNRPDTPLVLDFLFLGSRLEAGAYYGIGTMQAQAQLAIRAGIGNTALPGLTRVWGFDDRLVLGNGNGFQAQQADNVDITGIGLPAVQADGGWRDMVVTGRLNRAAFGATLDFGLLQPGEYFALHYSSEVRIVSNTPYATSARAEVIDPFGLRDDPPLQMSLQGLVLPPPVGVVPEPASAALMLAGGLGLVAWLRRRRPGGVAPRQALGPTLGLVLGLFSVGAAQATATAQASSDVFEQGRLEQIDAAQPAFATVALSGAGALNTGPGDGNFLATAAADLRRGTLRASAWSNTIGQGLTLSSASADLDDILSFDNAEDFTLTMELAVHGQFNGLGYVVGEVTSGLQLGGAGLATRLAWDTGVHGLPSVPVRLAQVTGGPSATRRVELRSNLAANTLLVLGVDTVVWPGRVLGVRAWLGAAAWATDNTFSQASFGNTARLSLHLPEGVQMQSASGLFLSQPAAPVPEPSSLALWVAGLVLPAWRRARRRGRRALAPAGAALLLATGGVPAALAATVLDYPVSFGNFYGDQPGVLDVHHRVTHLGSPIDGLQWWAGGYDDLNGVAWATYNSAGTLGHVDLRVLDGQPLRLDGFRLGSWAGAEGKLETVTVTAIGGSTPAWQFTGLIGVDNRASSFELGLQSTTGFTITWTNPWWTAIDDIRFQTAAVPEPGAAWLLLAGLAGLVPLVRRR